MIAQAAGEGEAAGARETAAPPAQNRSLASMKKPVNQRRTLGSTRPSAAASVDDSSCGGGVDATPSSESSSQAVNKKLSQSKPNRLLGSMRSKPGGFSGCGGGNKSLASMSTGNRSLASLGTRGPKSADTANTRLSKTRKNVSLAALGREGGLKR